MGLGLGLGLGFKVLGLGLGLGLEFRVSFRLVSVRVRQLINLVKQALPWVTDRLTSEKYDNYKHDVSDVIEKLEYAANK